jgi:Tol biopolymer transport system component
MENGTPLDADGSGELRLTETYGQFADWSPDGRYLVVAGEGGLTVIRPDRSGAASIPVGASLPMFPDWTP